mmetsp:Transcript_38809/g.88227  ORF Transcript_38809/g.88227 Transcript_38809/m.88227 type:complete len:202 (-) Transcript_38809:365-970(-)
MGDLLDELLQALRLVNAYGFFGVPSEVEGCGRPQLDEFKQSTEESSSQVFSLHGVIANYGRVHVHEDNDLFALLRILMYDVRKVLGVFHRVEDVRLHEYVVELSAVVYDRVSGSMFAAKAIVALAEVHKLACGHIPKVADAWTGLVSLPVQVVVEEENAHGFVRISTGNCRDHLCIAVRLLVLPPDRETGGCHVQVGEVLA